MNRLHSHRHNRPPHRFNNHGRLHSILSNRKRRGHWHSRIPEDNRDRQPVLSNNRQCGRRNNRRRDRHNITPSHNPTWDSSPYRNRLHNPHTADTMGRIGRKLYSTLKNCPRITTPGRMNPITVRKTTRDIPISHSPC